ncbi:MAG: glycosyltransferase family 9 protein [Candidatus Omnitrophica bacterium]|nr:glycosyltransferase family 9 protein [Candidatus Omnitrophota bacterium]
MNKSGIIRDIKKAVIIRTDRIGEVLLCTPVIDALMWSFPGVKISFVTSDYSKDIITGRPDIERVIIFSTIGCNQSFFKALRLAWTLKAGSFDMAVVLNPHKLLHLAVFLAGIKYRVGFDRKWGFLLNAKVTDKRDEAEYHEAEYNLRLLRAVDVYRDGILPSMSFLPQRLTRVRAILKEQGLSGDRKVIVIHPGSSNPYKIYPAEKFVVIIKALAYAKAADIVLIGHAGERALCDRIAADSGQGVYNLCGFFDLKGLAALFQCADLFITNDNGPMHIAACSGTRVLALFNRKANGSNPRRWSPCGKGHVVLYKTFSELEPEEVIEQARLMLKE